MVLVHNKLNIFLSNFFFSFQFLNISGSIAAFAYNASHSDIDYMKSLGLGGFIFSFTNVLVYLFHLDEYIPLWIYFEIGFNILWSFMYIVGSSLMTNWGIWVVADMLVYLHIFDCLNPFSTNAFWCFPNLRKNSAPFGRKNGNCVPND